MTDRSRPITPSYAGHGEMRGRVGVVIPAWYSAETAPEVAERLLLTTLADSPACVAPQDIVVVVDSSPVAAEAARTLQGRLAHEWGEPFELVELPENRGKGAALVTGIRRLLDGDEDRSLNWIATRDADGDHLIDDLPHLFRAGTQVEAEGGPLVCVIGRRASLHAPMGWVRGEYELLLNEVLIDAVAFRRAQDGAAWDTRYLAGRVPDLQSGYKLFNRAAAARAADSLESEAATRPDLSLLRVGMEIVPFVSLALEGAAFAETERKTYFDQPVTSYGRVDLPHFYGSKLAWALERCGIPPAAAAIILDGALGRRPLFTDPDGRASLLAMRSLVLDTLCGATWPPEVPPMPRLRMFL